MQLSISSHPYPQHPHRIGENSLHQQGTLGCTLTIYVNRHPNGFWIRSFYRSGVVITVFVALFLYCTFKIYLAIRISSRKCVIKSVFSVQMLFLQGWGPRGLASTSRTPRGQNCVALALASKTPGLGLEDPWPWPWPRRCAALTLASRSGRKTLNFWVWLISKGLNTKNTILHTQAHKRRQKGVESDGQTDDLAKPLSA